MRLDKFLKVSRIFKRRVVAKEVALTAKVLVNGRVAKPSQPVNPGDLVTIIYQSKEVTIKVLDLAMPSAKEKAASLYEIVQEKTLI